MKKILSILSIAALFGAVSCNDILNQSPTDRYTDAQVWKDASLIESNLADLYAISCHMINDALCVYSETASPINIDFSASSNWSANMGFSAQGEGPVHATTWADEAKYSERGAQANFLSMKRYGIQSNDNTLRWWSNAYYLNRQLNHFIDQIAQSELTDAKIYAAEARFLRAFNYFALVKRYGGVPIITKEQGLDAPEEELYPARNTEQEVYDFIIKECEEAAEDMVVTPIAGRASKWAALALGGKAALYAGSIAKYGTVQMNGIVGIPADKAKSYYEKARDLNYIIKTTSPHSLYTGSGKDKVQDLKDIFLVKDNPEAIMVKRHQGVGGGKNLWSWDMCVCPKPNAWSVGWYSQPYYDFVEQFDFIDGTSGKIDRNYLTSKTWTMDEFYGQRDPRLRAWLWTNGTSWPGAVGKPAFEDNTVSIYRGLRFKDGSEYFNLTAETYQGVLCYGDQVRELAGGYDTGFGVAKYLDPAADVMTWFVYSTGDYLIFRYAEVVLNYAEACLELGENGNALSAVNEIRSRAGVANLTSITTESYRKERMVELCFENHRYWDLRRWRQAVEELNGPHDGLVYVLDWESLQAGSPRFWLKIEDHVDSKVQDPTFPEKNYYLPIGDATIAANPNLKENPGY